MDVAGRRPRSPAVRVRPCASVRRGAASRDRCRRRCGHRCPSACGGLRQLCGHRARQRQVGHDRDCRRLVGDAHPPRLHHGQEGRDGRRRRRRRDDRAERGPGGERAVRPSRDQALRGSAGVRRPGRDAARVGCRGGAACRGRARCGRPGAAGCGRSRRGARGTGRRRAGRRPSDADRPCRAGRRDGARRGDRARHSDRAGDAARDARSRNRGGSTRRIVSANACERPRVSPFEPRSERAATPDDGGTVRSARGDPHDPARRARVARSCLPACLLAASASDGSTCVRARNADGCDPAACAPDRRGSRPRHHPGSAPGLPGAPSPGP
jgi:hypothetical protein